MQRIGFHSDSFTFSEWQDAFDQLGADIQLVDTLVDTTVLTEESIHTLLIWKPSQYDWRNAKNLQRVIWLGAGIDTELMLPAHVSQHRLTDAGMCEAMCDYAHYAVLHYQRRFDVFLQAQKQQHWVTQRNYCNRQQLSIGVLGLGHLGCAIAQYFAERAYSVVGWSRTKKCIEDIDTFAGTDALPHFLGCCDVLINMLPHIKETTHLLNENRLKQLPKGAALISLSRGAIIDTQALLKLLDQDYLRGAFMDVFEEEPLPPNSPLWTHPKVRITPHQSAPTQPFEAAKEIVQLLATE